MHDSDLTGSEVAGRYEVVRLIGRGGMGSVYEIVHKVLGRRFAMKTLSPHLAEDGEALARFRREAEAIARLHHPNIIEVIDWDVMAGETPFMVLELLRGESLAACIDRAGQLAWDAIASIGDQVLSALDAAHQAQIVHRDLKPQNVFLAEDDSGGRRVKLLDFGISKVRSDKGFQTTDDRIIGTPAFMAPEQAAGRQSDVGPQSDVWAMGAMLFMMATGKPPFVAAGIPQLLYRICHDQAPPVIEARPDAPPEFAELVAAALSRDPGRRITEAGELRERLGAALAAVSPARAPGPARRSSAVPVPVELPSGTITFLFTDIEGSTRLWELHPEAMNVCIARHDALMRAGIEKHGGRVFKTTGDGVFAAFAEPDQAALAAVDVQRSLFNADWEGGPALRVRMAIHTGPAHRRGGDYFGPTLNRVARVLSLAHGGQVLVTGTSASSLRPVLTGGFDLLDLGIHRLRDLTRPEHLYQLVHPELARQFETLRTPAKVRTNLPNPLSSFIGRRREIEDLARALSESRLVTITGLGGCGKTRLAVQAAAGRSAAVDGVWFVELASLTDGALVPQTIAEVIDLVREGLFSDSQPWLERLARNLEDKRVLLVLDNCEHLTRECAHVAGTLLSRCRQLSILATSREPLGVPGEMIYPLSPLTVADDAEPGDLAAIEALDSVRLFVDRARLVKPSFALTADNASVVLQICRQLEGIPLALELAAARLTVLSAESINARLRDRFSLLRRSDSAVPGRQRSLRDLLDWSHELLDEAERALFARLAVFRGTFPLAAVEAICAGPPVSEASVLDLLDQLAHKSLVQPSHDAGEPRYRLLETVREYAQAKLRESGEESELRARHCDWYIDLAERAEPELRGRAQTSTLDLLEAEFDNIRFALSWSLESDGVQKGLRLAGALWWFWIIRGHLSEGRHHLERVLSAPGSADQPATIRAKALAGAGLLTALSDPARAGEQLEASLELAREAQDGGAAALALFGLGLQSLFSGDLAAMQRWLGESRERFLALGDDWGRGMASMFLGPITGIADRAAGEATCREAVEAFDRTGDRVGMAYALINFGEIPRAHGDDREAARLYDQGLALCREVGDRTGTVVALTNLGMALGASEDPRADECLRESLALIEDIGFVMLAPHCLLGLAGVAVKAGQAQRAAQLLGASHMLKEAAGSQFHPADQLYFEKVFLRLRELLEEEDMLAEWARGEALSPEQAISFALGRGLLRAADSA